VVADTHSCFSQNALQHIKMDEVQTLTLQSNPLRFGRYLERNQDPQQEQAVEGPDPDPRIRLPIPGEYVVGGQRVFEKRIKQKTLETLYELGLYDSEAPIILHGIVSRGDFSQVQIVVTNTGTEDFALVDMGKLIFTVEQFHSMPKRGGPYNMTMLQNYYLHAITVSPSGTSDEEGSHSDNDEAMKTA
jgi:hypothetical protein